MQIRATDFTYQLLINGKHLMFLINKQVIFSNDSADVRKKMRLWSYFLAKRLSVWHTKRMGRKKTHNSTKSVTLWMTCSYLTVAGRRVSELKHFPCNKLIELGRQADFVMTSRGEILGIVTYSKNDTNIGIFLRKLLLGRIKNLYTPKIWRSNVCA